MTVIKSQGTHLFFIDKEGDIQKLTCPTGVTGVNSGSKGQINATCLEDKTDEQFVAGLRSAGATAVPYNVHQKDESHMALDALDASNITTQFMACLSDGIAAPTVLAGKLVPPVDRTCIAWMGYVAENTWDVGQNDIVKGNLSIQRSGPVTKTYPA